MPVFAAAVAGKKIPLLGAGAGLGAQVISGNAPAFPRPLNGKPPLIDRYPDRLLRAKKSLYVKEAGLPSDSSGDYISILKTNCREDKLQLFLARDRK